MNWIHRKVVIWAMASAAILTTGGCLAMRVDLVERGTVTVEQEQSRHLRFMWLDVYTEDNRVYVSGTIQRPRQWRVPVRGVVDVKVLSPTGETLEEVETPYFPRSIPMNGTRSSRFKVRLDTIPVSGSVCLCQASIAAKGPNGVNGERLTTVV